MHRTEGEGFILEGGKRRFVDENLPTYEGSADTAGYNNAVQEELCNLVELTGGTLAAGESADRTAGWRQVYDAIFQSAKIDTAALTNSAVTTAKINNLAVTNAKLAADIQLNKISGGTLAVSTTKKISFNELLLHYASLDDLTYSKLTNDLLEMRDPDLGTLQMNLTAALLQFSRGGSTNSLSVSMASGAPSVTLTGTQSSSTRTITTSLGGFSASRDGNSVGALLEPTGLRFYGSAHNGETDVLLRTSVFALPVAFQNDVSSGNVSGGVVYFGPGSVDAHGHSIGPCFATSWTLQSIGLPNTAIVLSMSVAYTDATGAKFVCPASAKLQSDAGLWKTYRIALLAEAGVVVAPDFTQPCKLSVVYDAQNMTF